MSVVSLVSSHKDIGYGLWRLLYIWVLASLVFEAHSVRQISISNAHHEILLNGLSVPPLELKMGETYEFLLLDPGCAFFVKTGEVTSGGGLLVDPGLTGNGLERGGFRWSISNSTPNSLHYLCGQASNNIYIMDSVPYLRVWGNGKFISPGVIVPIPRASSNSTSLPIGLSIDLLNSGEADLLVFNISFDPPIEESPIQTPLLLPPHRLTVINIPLASKLSITIQSSDIQFLYSFTLLPESSTALPLPSHLSSTAVLFYILIGVFVLLVVSIAVGLTCFVMNKIYFSFHVDEEEDFLGEEYNDHNDNEVVLEERVIVDE
eukprot:TRINITY_DN4406_c0_g1_i1.p1 TRINITY_DN4406_c0_g1~~TRINITY_DN4406_c0_g1_i1.p1  ORF type:complete len:319 (+),score=29.82 TRINITY_DN4406_c0_g1_i1:63-1019(+)